MKHHERKSPRLTGFDYSSENYYFLTICAKEKKCIFGTIEALNSWGEIAYQNMVNLESHYDNVSVPAFVIMPNHIHAIIAIEHNTNPDISLGNIVGSYKAGVTKQIRQLSAGADIWQRSFHDHVIRNQRSYEKIWTYILFNRQKWEEDCFFPTAQSS